MLKVLLFIGAVGFISWQFAIFFNDIWLRDAQHKKLRHKFEDWWLTVEDLDKLKLALACTVKLNAFLDDIFGIRLFSGLAFGRISIAASGLLIASLSLLGLFSHEKLGIEPWKNYRETAKGVEDFIPQLQSSYRAMPITTLTTNVQLNHESHLFTTNVVTITNTSKTVLIEKLETVKLATQKYNTNTFVAIYSIVF